MSSTLRIPLSSEELDAQAATLVGEIVFAFSRLEMEMSFSLRNAVGAHNIEALNRLIERLSFKAKLDALRDVIKLKFVAQADALEGFERCLREIDEFRKKRNNFIHGRWGSVAHAQQVVNVAPGVPGASQPREERFTLDELTQVCNRLLAVTNEFRTLRHRWDV